MNNQIQRDVWDIRDNCLLDAGLVTWSHHSRSKTELDRYSFTPNVIHCVALWCIVSIRNKCNQPKLNGTTYVFMPFTTIVCVCVCDARFFAYFIARNRLVDVCFVPRAHIIEFIETKLLLINELSSPLFFDKTFMHVNE